ncbi:serine/threonine-protein kinase STE20 [Aplysia californica]|uniref:Serine/threonine-protein kinase STE20 n=1 Tax=Aplysia californica TaxID=6500 RepID=A0ABM0JUV2_APLCA|nr:serine/threonine-protein kinase STE20 [Aplysia californica]
MPFYVDNAQNRSLGRVGLPHGAAVFSRSSGTVHNRFGSQGSSFASFTPSASGASSSFSPSSYSTNDSNRSFVNTYVDNPTNRRLDRVGLPHGTAVQSKISNIPAEPRFSVSAKENPGRSLQDGRRNDSNSSFVKTYVDNPTNRRLDRVGLPHGAAVQSKISNIPAEPRFSVSAKENPGRSFSSHTSVKTAWADEKPQKLYADNPRNERLGRAGKPLGSMPVKKKPSCDSPRMKSDSCDHASGANAASVNPPKVYVDNAQNRKLGRALKPLGSMPVTKTKADSSRQGNERRKVDEQVTPQVSYDYSSDQAEKSGESSGSVASRIYADNPFNRAHHRAGLPLGSRSISRDGTYQGSKYYVDNALNRKLNRVGELRGSRPVIEREKVYSDNPLNRKYDRVGKKWGTSGTEKDKAHQLYEFLKVNEDRNLPGPLEQFCDEEQEIASQVKSLVNREQQAIECVEGLVSDSNWSVRSRISTSLLEKFQGNIIRFEDLTIGKEIGQGGFGVVYMSTLDREVVAVKKLKVQQLTKRRMQQFENEVSLFCVLSNPNILQFIGACIEKPNLAIVMEYMDMSLFDALHIKQVDFPESTKLALMDHMTLGLMYLHNNDIAHCDLKTQNILLNNVPGQEVTVSSEPVVAKICDFGLSMMKSDTETTSTNVVTGAGSPRYAAPEVLREEKLSLEQLKKADMYSMGLLLFELSTEVIPFEDLNIPQLIRGKGHNGETPEFSLRLDIQLEYVIKDLWSFDPNSRPTSETLTKEVDNINSVYALEE